MKRGWVMMSKEIRAEDFRQLKWNCSLKAGLKPGSIFYVDLDEARNGKTSVSVRKRIMQDLQDCYEENKEDDIDEFQYTKLLFAGHKASGKTTELHLIERDLQDEYFTVYIPDIEKSEDRFATETDFLYFIMETIVQYCEEQPDFERAIENDAQTMLRYLSDKIFGTEFQELTAEVKSEVSVEAGAELSRAPFQPLLSLFAKLSAKEIFEDNTKRTITTAVRNYFDEFMELSNQLILHLQNAAHKKGKMFLLILDGLDKLKEEVSQQIFLSTQSFLTQLNCSMIVTFPVYLLYSPKQNQAIQGYERSPYILSMVKVKNRDGSRNDTGIEALRELVEKRVDVKALFENPDDLTEAIENSGGNMRDLFQFLVDAAGNARGFDVPKIRSMDLNNAYIRARSEYRRQFTQKYLPIMEEILNDPEKNQVIQKTPEDDTLLNMFDAGLLIEYNGERWCDLHPLVKAAYEQIPKKAERES